MPRVHLDGSSLHFEESGAGAPVLLLHGLGSSGQDWELVAPRLAAGHRVIVPDVRGHGRSDKPAGPYGVPLFARDISTLCERLGLTRVHVVGLSMGGMIGFQLAVERPELVRSLTVVNSGPDMVPRTMSMRLMFATRLLMLKTLGPRVLARMLAPKLFPKPEQAELRRRVVESIGANEPDAYLRATRGLVGWTVLERLKDISCPVLVLASDQDYTPLSAKQAYVDRLADARLRVLKDSRHAAPLDAPEQIVEAVKGFFLEVEGQELGARSVG
ncbi:alpha/beta fold hydrolase [Vitiosangium sp. GDMCC 1.1324]|uniref:alpha/beta fold hydrolase n=1 Tax=Vitiosangium sp. (strain GDMCC 1.1324) TaxID=2138576 RepID=UPI000D342227|nr:alpha/beta hydrolase [Vitiosangium sp. GDMCC 1.1324]PTL83696.1 3-oxoadipate enol-lactonase [Vitiosangium sp. GDMCC 1.1324]